MTPAAPSATNSRRVHLRIHGLVQGVSYRASARDTARALGLKGWVRNLSDGDVEAVAEGPHAPLERFIAWCHHGPQEARVESVVVGTAPEGALGDFEVVR